MEAASPKDNSVASSPFSSPNISALLKIKILSWSQETGLPASIRVRLGDRIFCLHKLPLSSKSRYFNRKLNDSTEVELPQDFPGGLEIFEKITLFVYGSSTLVDPFNVAALRCAAEFLEMTEEYCSGNLCERFDLYLNQVVLQNWDDTLIVLQKCQTLLPCAEDLLIVSRCIESLAFMACMEILDPERRRDRPVLTLEPLASSAWNCKSVKEFVSQDLWVKDLIALPFGFFKRIIASLRRQGMKEKYVSPMIVFYANKWVISAKALQFRQNSGEIDCDTNVEDKVSTILHGILDLLPTGEKSSRIIPVGFYFAMLSKSLELDSRSEIKSKLQDQIASLLPLAHVGDFILPKSRAESVCFSIELATMESIISTYVSFDLDMNHTPSMSNSVVAELWDAYLANIALDPKLGPQRFMELIEAIPLSYRQSHDNLYRALNTFLQAHPDASQDEKTRVCKYLSCQKLSQEVCINAVQNELMPLRLIVQALFIQQLNTHQAFKECSDSFRYAHCGEFSGSLSSSKCPYSKSQNLGESPFAEEAEPGRRPLSALLQKDHTIQGSDMPEKEYESTSFRIQTLEQELMSLKRSLQWQNISKRTELASNKVKNVKPFGLENRSMSRRKNPLGQKTGCIGSATFATQRKYASRLMKIFRRITLFGGRKMRKKSGATGPRTRPI
ncbi:BTB/POZ domain-containing protein At5g48130 [Syzygium oleosum]|uniref:BTB/POZ domain-containing protein At5g48130 n=1 Tax=Syzygium oleosum TaxID=219896 RepID=UPI0024BB326D|nr:BTB/POZ domain-containing protein At5g48130 [Syzygium oleosum]